MIYDYHDDLGHQEPLTAEDDDGAAAMAERMLRDAVAGRRSVTEGPIRFGKPTILHAHATPVLMSGHGAIGPAVSAAVTFGGDGDR